MHKTHLRSFSRRIGKTLSKTQKSLIENDLEKYIFDINASKQLYSNYKQIAIEVGIGMAEHFVSQAKQNPETLFIGIEPYLNGIANALKLAGESNVTNFRLWPDDADQILSKMDDVSIDKFYLLFPDPWPKKKQKKRRFASIERLNMIKNLLKENGEFIFASDIDDYSNDVTAFSSQISLKKQKEVPHDGYVETKFHRKAIESGREAKFFTFIKE